MSENGFFKDRYEKLEQDPQYWAEKLKIEFAVELNEIMAKSGIKPSDLAEKLNSSRPYVTKLLSGDSNFTIETMAKVANAVGARVHIKLETKNKKVYWKKRSHTNVYNTFKWLEDTVDSSEIKVAKNDRNNKTTIAA